MASVELPHSYAGATGAELRADAATVRLRSRCDVYFDLGARLARLLRVPALAPAVLAAAAALCRRVVWTHARSRTRRSLRASTAASGRFSARQGLALISVVVLPFILVYRSIMLMAFSKLVN